MLPSDEWQVIPLHWHAFATLPRCDSTPDAVLRDPYAVASWVAERTRGAELWHAHFRIASRGDSIRHHEVIVVSVTNEQCIYDCAIQSGS